MTDPSPMPEPQDTAALREVAEQCQCGRGPVVAVAFKRNTSMLVRRLCDVGHQDAADLRCADCIGDLAEEVGAHQRRGWHPDFGGPGMQS